MSEVAVQIDNLSKIYKIYEKPIDRMKEALSPSRKKYHKNHYALNDISFEVNKGETIGLIGTNGSGKSTILKIITGVLSPSSGNVRVNGKISALLELGAGFNPEYTGIENIYLNGTMFGYSKEEISVKLESILEFADIGEFVDQPVKTYSSGMFARLAFAVAINIEPDILIVDEALSVGDSFFQNKCFKKFDELRKRNVTIIFVSHDIASIKRMCNRTLWIEKGEKKAFGETNKICNLYFNEQKKILNKETNIDETIEHLKLTVKTSDEKEKIERKIKFPKINLTNDNILSEDVEIISFFISDEKDEMVEVLIPKEVYNFNCIIKFEKSIKNGIVGFVLENTRGIQLVASNTFLSTEKVFDAKSGDVFKVSFRITLPKLLKGEYLISPAIAIGDQQNHKILTWLHNTNKIYIDNNGYNVSLLEIENEVEIESINKESFEII